MTDSIDQRQRDPVAKGRRPWFFDNPDTDKLLAMLLALAGEVSVLRDRLDTHERLAKAGLVATPEIIDAYEIDEATEDQRAAMRKASLERVLRILKESSADDIARAERAYSAIVEETARS